MVFIGCSTLFTRMFSLYILYNTRIFSCCQVFFRENFLVERGGL
nr:MAG TPA: hypothetical protein [Caudoviricetes sp.]